MAVDIFELLGEDPELDMDLVRDLFPKYDCPECKDTGVVYQGHPVHMPGPCHCITKWETPAETYLPVNHYQEEEHEAA